MNDFRVSRAIIGTNDGLVYLAPIREQGLYTAIPVDDARTIEVTKQHRGQEPSLLEFVGLR